MSWQVVVVFVNGTAVVDDCIDEEQAARVAAAVAANGYCDVGRRQIVPTSQIGAISWREKPKDAA